LLQVSKSLTVELVDEKKNLLCRFDDFLPTKSGQTFYSMLDDLKEPKKLRKILSSRGWFLTIGPFGKHTESYFPNSSRDIGSLVSVYGNIFTLRFATLREGFLKGFQGGKLRPFIEGEIENLLTVDLVDEKKNLLCRFDDFLPTKRCDNFYSMLDDLKEPKKLRKILSSRG